MEKKVIWGGLAGGLTFFILGFLFYGLMLKDFFDQNSPPGVWKEEPDFPMLIIGNIVMGLLYAVVVGVWAKAASASEGAKRGFVLGLLLGIGFDLMMYSTSMIMTMTTMVADIAVTTVMGTIVGSVVASVMGKKAATSMA